MTDPTDADKAKAQRIVEEWHGNSLPPYQHRHLERRISQALADERETMRERCENLVRMYFGATAPRLTSELLEELRKP